MANATVDDFLDRLEDMPLASSLNAIQEARSLLSELENPDDSSIEEVQKKIAGLNPALYGFIFKHAGIKATGKSKLSENLSLAINKLGFDRVKKLIFLHVAFSQDLAAGKNLLDREFSAELWTLNFRTANIAVHWAERLMPDWREEVFYLAMLQNLGITAFAQLEPSHHRALRDSTREIPLADKERDLFSFDHYDLARGIIKRWSMPELHSGAQSFEGSHGQSCGVCAGEECEDIFTILYLAKYRAATKARQSSDFELRQAIDPYFAFSQAVIQIAREQVKQSA